MSAAAHPYQPDPGPDPAPVRSVADLDVPGDLAEAVAKLPGAMSGHVAADLLRALRSAQATGDLTPVQRAVDRWREFAPRTVRELAELKPEANRIRAALRAGATLESLGLVDDAQASLERIAAARGITLRA